MRDRAAGAYLKDDTVLIRIQVGAGSGSGCAWGCDLSDQYVRINADYTT
jgi:glutamate N-acetyltransferase/amino-acid N-acetyltransferase